MDVSWPYDSSKRYDTLTVRIGNAQRYCGAFADASLTAVAVGRGEKREDVLRIAMTIEPALRCRARTKRCARAHVDTDAAAKTLPGVEFKPPHLTGPRVTSAIGGARGRKPTRQAPRAPRSRSRS